MVVTPKQAIYEKAKVFVRDSQGGRPDEIEVLFNPTEYSVEKRVQYGEVNLPGMETPLTQFVSGTAETLSMELFLDTSDSGADVREETAKFDRLVMVDGELHAPPICEFVWGSLTFRSVVESVAKQFTLFLPDGRPVRAKLSVSFKRYETPSEQLKRKPRGSADRTALHRTVEGDTLWSLAAAEYGDAGRWRAIAAANDIDDPRDLETGRELRIPPL